MSTPILFDARASRVGVQWRSGPLHGLRLALGWLRTISCASALTLASVLSGMLLVTTALTLAIVLALAGVLGKVHRIGGYKHACKP
jgi:hypothetical protein